MTWVERTNRRIAASPVGRWFQLEGSGHGVLVLTLFGQPRERKGSYFFTEIRAGLACFFAMAYIIAINASIVSETGGPCVCNGGPKDPTCDKNEEYALCIESVKRDLVTATAAISALSTFFMGLLANLPVGLAPGMGLNAYFTYNVVGVHGTKGVSYETALAAIFIEGFIFFALALFGMRQWLARAIPRSIKLATSAGIGLFLTIIGMTYSEGIGLIVGDSSTPTTLAGCSPENQYAEGDPAGTAGTCPTWDIMRYPAMWIGIFCGGIFTVVLMMYRVKGAVIAGILLVSIISWPRDTAVTYFPYTAVGNDNFDFFKKVVDFHGIKNTLNVVDWDVSGKGGSFGLALITFLYVDILDTTGTLYGMARFAGLVDPVTQDFEGSSVAYMVDAISISIGALFGCPPVTAFVESGAGISEGGKTGLTAMSAGICFFISVFFAPIFASIPPWGTGCVLILVGAMMITSVTDINWKYLGDAVPAFLTIAIMPLAYSISYGLIAGVCTYILLNTLVWAIKVASGGRIVPPNYEDREGWTWRMPGGFFPPWVVRLFSGKKDFWRRDEPAVVETVAQSEKSVAGRETGSDQGINDERSADSSNVPKKD